MKFILLTDNRTGSTLVQEALNSHPNLGVESEILCFHAPETSWACQERQKLAKEMYFGKHLKGLNEYSDLIPLINRIFQKFDGFKIHRRNQIACDNPAWVYLANKPDLKVIHLIRRNKLLQYISLMRSNKSQVWHVDANGQKPELPKVHIDVNAAWNLMRSWEIEEEYFKNLFAFKDNITIYYEDLLKNTHNVLAYVQGFLGVEMQELLVAYQKVNPDNIDDMVENVEEVRSYFSKTNYAWML